jgi:hypothetical protein
VDDLIGDVGECVFDEGGVGEGFDVDGCEGGGVGGGCGADFDSHFAFLSFFSSSSIFDAVC